MSTPQFNIRANSFRPPNPSNQQVKCVSSKPKVRQINTKIPSVPHTRQFNTKQRAFCQTDACVLNWPFLLNRWICVELTNMFHWRLPCVERTHLCWSDGCAEMTVFLCWTEGYVESTYLCETDGYVELTVFLCWMGVCVDLTDFWGWKEVAILCWTDLLTDWCVELRGDHFSLLFLMTSYSVFNYVYQPYCGRPRSWSRR